MNAWDFIRAFEYFCAKRNTPLSCYSDNGTNFRASHKFIASLFNAWKEPGINEIANMMAVKGVEWKFNVE